MKAARQRLGWPLTAALLGALLLLAGCDVGAPASDRGAFQPAGREAAAAVIELVVGEEAALRRVAAQTDQTSTRHDQGRSQAVIVPPGRVWRAAA